MEECEAHRKSKGGKYGRRGDTISSSSRPGIDEDHDDDIIEVDHHSSREDPHSTTKSKMKERASSRGLPRDVGQQEKTPRAISGKTPQTISEKTSQAISGRTPLAISGRTPQAISGRTPQAISGGTPQAISGKTPRTISEKTQRTISQKTPPAISEKICVTSTSPVSHQPQTMMIAQASQPGTYIDTTTRIPGILDGDQDIIEVVQSQGDLHSITKSKSKERNRESWWDVEQQEKTSQTNSEKTSVSGTLAFHQPKPSIAQGSQPSASSVTKLLESQLLASADNKSVDSQLGVSTSVTKVTESQLRASSDNNADIQLGASSVAKSAESQLSESGDRKPNTNSQPAAPADNKSVDSKPGKSSALTGPVDNLHNLCAVTTQPVDSGVSAATTEAIDCEIVGVVDVVMDEGKGKSIQVLFR